MSAPAKVSRHMRRYNARKQYAHEYLGGKCEDCGSQLHLQIDHVNPESKRFDLMGRWSAPWQEWCDELEKCQLLCADCHEAKNEVERKAKYQRRKAREDAPF